MRKEKLSDMLKKMTQKKKWQYFNEIANKRDPSLLFPIDVKKRKADRDTLSFFMKDMKSELSKMNYPNFIVMLRFIRTCFLDDEDIMISLVKEGLDKLILDAIMNIRRRSDESKEYSLLEEVASNVSDMFEWDFFGETLIDSYIQELLTTLHSTPDYLNSLHTDTADALMTICATNVESVVQAYISTKSNFQFLIEILYKLPRSKSFHYQALLLEIVYRMHRQLKKHDGSRELNSMGKKLIEALPHEISKELVKISPKKFRDSTRDLLNRYNERVGVIQSYGISHLSCTVENDASTVYIGDTKWLDLGGVGLEAEVTYSKGKSKDEDAGAMLKVPYNKIEKFEVIQRENKIQFWVKNSASLADLIEGIEDQKWGQLFKCCFTVTVSKKDIKLLHANFEEKLAKSPLSATVEASSKAIKTEKIESIAFPHEKLKPETVDTTAFSDKSSQISCDEKPNLHIKMEKHTPGQHLRRRNKGTNASPRPNSQHLAASYGDDFDDNFKTVLLSTKKKREQETLPLKTEKKAPKRRKFDTSSAFEDKKILKEEKKKIEVSKTLKKTDQLPQHNKRNILDMDVENEVEQHERDKIVWPKLRASKRNQANPVETKKTLKTQKEATTNTLPAKMRSALSLLTEDVPQETEHLPDKFAKLIARDLGHTLEASAFKTPHRVKQSLYRSKTPIKVSPNSIASSSDNDATPLSEDSKPPLPRKSSKQLEIKVNKRRKHIVVQDEGTTILGQYDEKKLNPELLGEIQEKLMRDLDRVVEDILQGQQAYRSYVMTTLCNNSLKKFEQNLKRKTAPMTNLEFFEITEHDFKLGQEEWEKHVIYLGTLQDAMKEILGHCESTEHNVEAELGQVESELEHLAHVKWKREFEHDVGEIRSLATSRLQQTKSKLQTIEKSFNTEDLFMMQQMLERI